MPFRLLRLLLLVLFISPTLSVGEENVLPLKLDRTFNRLPDPIEKTAVFIEADHIEANQGRQFKATGNARYREHTQAVSADEMLYDDVQQQFTAQGSVVIEQPHSTVRGTQFNLNLDTHIGDLQQPVFYFEENHARGSAEKVNIAGTQYYEFENANYTTCPIEQDDWMLKMSRLTIDRAAQVGVAHHARIEFFGVPLLYTPWMDFPLNSNRRTGVLSPLFGSTHSSGTELTVPYYLNLAPYVDATLSPRWLEKRGTQLNNEVRYLQPNFAGELQADALLNDNLSHTNRTHFSLKHGQQLGYGVSASLNLNRVSDDNYYRDLATTVAATSQTNLLQEGVLNYAVWGWQTSARVQHYQTLQDPLAPVLAPYWRHPQLNASTQQSLLGATLALHSEYVDFRHPTLVNGRRLVTYPSISYPLLSHSGYFLTPKVGVHRTQYALDTNTAGYLPNSIRTLPIFSLDSGLIFERSDSFLGNGYMQTLEPRAYYVRIPYQDQSLLPNFDTAQAPFSFSQMFTENRFLGSDRVGDADMLTVALTSRAIDDEDGVERIKIAAAERFTFSEPLVNFATPTNRTTRSDILLTAGGRMTRHWTLDSLLQFNPNANVTESYNVAASYKPEAGKVLNLGYRYTRGILKQMDIATQWPISGRWHSVGRFNYSLHDQRILEALGGLEYNENCWTLRLVAQTFATAAKETTTGVFVQLELNDLVRIGSDPLAALRTSVIGYTKLNDVQAAPSIQGLQ
ncbi:MAG: LPS-assembly protein LptD [Sideroxydans sp.]|nr:LPS-assembly protein LptD [Sideroxydans sp.]